MNNLAILTLNCQKAYHPDLPTFLEKTLSSEKYDFLLLQEVTPTIISTIINVTSSYKILNPFDSILGDTTGVCILYKEKFSLTTPLFISFAKIYRKIAPAAWGCVAGIFESGDQKYLISSLHLHAGLNFRVRMKELRLVKYMLKRYVGQGMTIIFGGDFNTGFPKELVIAKQMFSSSFKRVNKKLGATLNSRYTEKAPFILNKISVFLAKFGIGFTFRTDHFFVDMKTVAEKIITCSILPDRVSDHNPVELVINSH